MSRLYGEQHRKLQDDFGTRAMADRVEELVCRTEFDEKQKRAALNYDVASNISNAVSYTHLDVYKRQYWDGTRFSLITLACSI